MTKKSMVIGVVFILALLITNSLTATILSKNYQKEITKMSQTTTSISGSDEIETDGNGTDETLNDEPTKEEKKTIETEEILKTSQSFLDHFYTNNSENVNEKLKEIQPIMTEKASKNLRPYYLEDESPIVVQQALNSSRLYTSLNDTEGKAEVVGLLVVQSKFDGSKAYSTPYVVKISLQKEDKTWRVSDLEEATTHNEVPLNFFINQ